MQNNISKGMIKKRNPLRIRSPKYVYCLNDSNMLNSYQKVSDKLVKLMEEKLERKNGEIEEKNRILEQKARENEENVRKIQEEHAKKIRELEEKHMEKIREKSRVNIDQNILIQRLFNDLRVERDINSTRNSLRFKDASVFINLLGIPTRFDMVSNNPIINSDIPCSLCLVSKEKCVKMCSTCNGILCEECYLYLATTANGSNFRYCLSCKGETILRN